MENKRRICMSTGNLCFDIVTDREYPEGIEKQRIYSDHIVLQEAGGNCGNVVCNLGYYGWQTYPVGKIDTSLVAEQIIKDLERYGADTRYIFQDIKNDTPVVQYRQDTDKQGVKQVINKKFCSDGLYHRFRPNIKYITKNKEAKAILASLDFIPDVFYMGKMTPGIRFLAEELRKKGTMILTELNEKLDAKKILPFLNISDIIVSKPSIEWDMEDYDIDWSTKLLIKVDSQCNIQYNLTGLGWKTLPAPTAAIVDSEGSTEWLVATSS